jgi:hypothetical protein
MKKGSELIIRELTVGPHRTYNARSFDQSLYQSPKDYVNFPLHKAQLYLKLTKVSRVSYSYLENGDGSDENQLVVPLNLIDYLFKFKRAQRYYRACCRSEYLCQNRCT